VRDLRSGQSVLLLSPRRYGKTSLSAADGSSGRGRDGQYDGVSS
jgi:hypothetical protein